LTGTIASLFIGAGEAKAASEAGKVGNATRIENAAITAGKVTKAEKAAEQTSKLRQASEKIENAGKKLKNKASKIKSEIKPKKNCKVIAEANVTVDQQLLQNLSKAFPKYADDIGRIAGKRGNRVLEFIEKNGNSHNMKEIIRIFSNEKNFEYSKFMEFMIKNDKEAIKFMKKYDVEVLKKWNGELPKYWTSRPPYKDGQVEKVWENAKNGHEFWTDENGVEHIKMGGKKGTVSWDKTKPRNKQGEIPRNGQWDMGHIKDNKYDDYYAKFVNKEMNEKDFLDWYHEAKHYEPQTIKYNRSHAGE
uniref:GH-E family nuclease n=1 Tax=Treponema sp. TaxID=166 RepID=UPI00298DFEA8